MKHTSYMSRVSVKAFGGPDQLTLESVGGTLSPGGEELLVEVEAAGVNYLDVYQRRGGAYAPALPWTPGLEGVGRIRVVGAALAGQAPAFAVGQRVAWINVPGSYASQIVMPAVQAIAVPESFSSTQALLFQAITAQYLATEYRAVQPGDRVLVHAAAGGVGQLLVQWLKHLGAWVVGTTSSEAKAATARAAGADAVIVYGADGTFVDELMRLTAGRGVDLAFDGVGASTFAGSVKSLSRGGTAVIYGSASGAPAAIDPMSLITPGTRVAGGSLFTHIADPAEMQCRATAVIDAISAGWLRIGTGKAYGLDHANDAHRDIESRGTQGKLYLVPDRSAR